MTRGKVTLVSISSTSVGQHSRHAVKAVAEADIIWATTQVPADLLRHAAKHADIIIAAENPSIHSVLPFYDLASRGGFRVTRIYSCSIPPDEVLDQIDRCRELGLEVEIVRCP